jgi:hypothetical protein
MTNEGEPVTGSGSTRSEAMIDMAQQADKIARGREYNIAGVHSQSFGESSDYITLTGRAVFSELAQC